MSEMKIYEIDSQSKYHISVTRIENIEDAGDHFVTEDDLNEMGIDGYISTHSAITFDAKIRTELTILKRKIEKSGKKSCLIEDEELVLALKSSCPPASYYVDDIRRVGNRLSIHRNEKTTVNKRDGKSFLGASVQFICSKYKDKDNLHFHLDVKGGVEVVHEGSINFIRHNMKWKEFSTWILSDDSPSYLNYDEEDLKWWKMVYDNPKIFN